MTNPLLEPHELPPFSRLKATHVVPAITALIDNNKKTIDTLLAEHDVFSWDNLLAPLEALDDTLAQAWSPVGHLNSVCNSEAWREAYNHCLPLLSAYNTWLGQHGGLYEAYRQIAQSETFSQLSQAKQTAIEHALRDFRLAGVALEPEQKLEYGRLKSRLAELGSHFSENVLDATNAWSLCLQEGELPGLPDTALASARQAARQRDQEGLLINLEYPSLLPVLTYCDDAALREKVYTANCTRASDQGPDAGRWDNTATIEETLTLRRSLARLLGFNNYAELSLATKMAESPQQVIDFLQQLADKSRIQARHEWQALEQFAAQEHQKSTLQAWDVAYYSEKLRQRDYALSQEDIRPYLPLPRVLSGLFEVVRRLYGVEVDEVEDFERYHDDVRLFNVRQDGEVIARFYLDLYARPDKRGGAWMDDCRVRRRAGDQLQLPVAYLVCNFSEPVGDTPSLLTDQELTTLFHEFGHGLHHMLTQQNVAAVSGINGVAWDAVELPSQFLENWCWEPESLAFISGHYLSGEPLPKALLEKMLAARNFQSAMQMARQLEFSLFDFRLHLEWGDSDCSVQAQLDRVRKDVAVMIPPAWNRFQNSFSHIFSGGYAAGYYSYKWAEVLSADAYSRFEEEGIFNRRTGLEFRQKILEMGGADEPMTLFKAFRGREPQIEPLLRHSGIGG